MLTVLQPAYKLLTFYENQSFITVFTTARNWTNTLSHLNPPGSFITYCLHTTVNIFLPYTQVSQVVCTHQAGTLARIWCEFVTCPMRARFPPDQSTVHSCLVSDTFNLRYNFNRPSLTSLTMDRLSILCVWNFVVSVKLEFGFDFWSRDRTTNFPRK